jgi:uncharacterized protein (DUF1697 family)
VADNRLSALSLGAGFGEDRSYPGSLAPLDRWTAMRADPVMTRYVALLRGINVGGNNLIRMPALKACFEKQGFSDVVTYIQSGNVLFSAAEAEAAAIAGRIEGAIKKTFGCQASVALRTQKQMREIVAKAPKGFGAAPAEYRYDVIYLLPALTATAALKSVPTAPGVDTAHAGKGVLYFSRLIEKASQSRLSKLVGTPIYKSMTIRNWNTTTTLLRLIDAPAA